MESRRENAAEHQNACARVALQFPSRWLRHYVRGKLRSDRIYSAAYDLLGHGDIDFLNDKLNMDVRIGARGAGMLLTPLYNLFEYKGEGSISKPNWHPKNF